RFIDPAAVIRYDDQPEPDEVTFDREGAEFGHRGNRCTFETLLEAFGLDATGLDALAQIVHEIDLQDGLYARPEAPGLDAILSGWLAAGFADDDLAAHGSALFEGLYRGLSAGRPEEAAVEADQFQQEV
ncbi:MAG TPA: chromate resistance protein ChrB domain-containing protein, partial [Anaerolineae bacterium]